MKLVDHAAKIGAQNKLDDASLQESAPNMIRVRLILFIEKNTAIGDFRVD